MMIFARMKPLNALLGCSQTPFTGTETKLNMAQL